MKNLLLIVTAMLLPFVAMADIVEIDGIRYNLVTEIKEARVVEKTPGNNYGQYSGEIIIPSNVTYQGVNYSVTSIEFEAFVRCSGLTSVTIPNSVTSIGMYAFDGCSGLTSVTILCPYVNSWFSRKSSIKEIVLGNQVTSIGNEAFAGCSGLTSVTIPESVTSIGMYAFADCKGLTSVTIPNSVTSICESVFGGCSGLTSVTIPSSVTSIGDCAFAVCSGLTSVTIPNSVTSIGGSAFAGCSGLTSVTIPSSVTSIGYGAFSDCSGLTSVSCLCSPTSESINIFSGCTNIQEVTFNCETVTSLFSGLTSITKITMTDKVTSIGGSAFMDCSGLTSVTIPESVTSIGSSAFSGCSGLASVIIPNGVTEIGWSSFDGCTSLTSVTIPNSVTEICPYAFMDCISLTSVTIPNSMNSISECTFGGCRGLTSVTIGNGVTEIGSGAFGGCSGLKDVYCLRDNVPQTATDAFRQSDVKNTILHVKDYALESFMSVEPWSYFKEIVCDEIVTDFNLTYYVDNEVYKQYKHKYKDVITPEPFPEKEQYTFSGWSEIPETMPGKDVNIYGTFNPTEVTVDNVVYQIKDSKAYPIKNNKSGEVVISSFIEDRGKQYPVTTILSGVFENNNNITSVIIPDGIDMIEAHAFQDCKNLVTITIGNSISSIGERAFANIDKLADVTIHAENVSETDRTAFENSYIDYVTLHVPYGSINNYKTVGPWKDFKEIVAIEGTEPISGETCVMPTISFVDGKLEFKSETDGAECHYEIKVEDAKEGVGSEVTLSSAYEISIYASKEGYNDSPKNTATLYWINVDPTITGVIENEMRVNTNAILVQNTGGAIVITGVADGENVLIYNISGQLIAQGKASGNHVEVGTNLSNGDISIIKIGDKTVKYLLK